MASKVKTAEIPFVEKSKGDRVLRWPEVQIRTGLCRSHVHDLAKKGRFPVPIKLGGRASGWMESEISAWIEERKAARQGAQ